jgi:hypothetical protein
MGICLCNPVNEIDPTGNCPIGDDGKCIRGWQCDFIHDPIIREQCWNRCNTKSTDAAIPEPYYYPCSGTGSGECISPTDDPILQITHKIYGEGGSLSRQAAANILQTVLNRSSIYWSNHHSGINPNNLDWARINKTQLTKLFLFILSEPYGNNPAYNAWGSPELHYGSYWLAVMAGVELVLNNPGLNPTQCNIMVGPYSPKSVIRNNVNIKCFMSYDRPNPTAEKLSVWLDTMPEGASGSAIIKYQYYGVDPFPK